jgi:hypothetical protein
MQERTKEAVVTLFRDIVHAAYSGIRPQPGIDIEFRLERFHDTARLIRARLVRRGTDPVETFDFVTGGSFEMSALGRDYERLESIGADLISIASFIDQVSIVVELDGSALLRMSIAGEEVLFKIYAKAPDRQYFHPWEWFVDPGCCTMGKVYDHPIHVARPVREVAQVLATV